MLEKLRKTKNQRSNSKNKLKILVENTPYHVSPSFVSHNGKHASIVKMYVRQATNRQMTYDQVIDLIPVHPLEGVELVFLIKDTLIKYGEKTKLIKENSKANTEAIDNEQKDKDSQKNDDETKKEVRRAQTSDYLRYQSMMESAEPVVVYEIKLEIIAKSREIIDEQLEVMNLSLNTKHDGVEWDSLGGEQLEYFQGLFDDIEPSIYSMTSTGSNYAGINFAVSPGVFEDNGIPMGKDSMSISSSTAVFDFDKAVSKQAIISIPRNKVMARYKEADSNYQMSTASILSQYASNQIWMNGSDEGRKIHHMVLNDFDYFEKGKFYRPQAIEHLFDSFDCNAVTVNPLQGFGELKDVVNVFNRLTNKIVTIFDLLLDLKLTKDEKAIILDAVVKYYSGEKLWTNDADKYPQRTTIVNITDPATYPTMTKLLDGFTTLLSSALKSNRQGKADKIDTLESTLKQALTTSMSIIGRTTSIKRSNAPQIYYEFKNIPTSQQKQIQFVNMLDYIIYTAKPKDLIVIHGADQIYEDVLDAVKNTIKAAQDKGVRFLFSFDRVTSDKSKKDVATENYADIFTMNGSYYDNLSSDVDYNIIGRCTPDEVSKYSNAMKSDLGTQISSRMMMNYGCQIFLHKSLGHVSNFIHLDVKA